MAQLSSEDALNQILNILEVNIATQQEQKDMSPEQKADGTIVSLLQGIVETAKNDTGGAAGSQLEKLANGLTAMKDVDNEAIDNISTSIDRINKSLNSIDINDTTIDGINGLVNAINKITEINSDSAVKLGDFIGSLMKSLNEILIYDNKALNKLNTTVTTINKVFNSIRVAPNTIENIEQLQLIIDKLTTIDPSGTQKIIDFINNVKLNNPKDAYLNIQTISNTITVLTKLTTVDLEKLTESLDNIDPDDTSILGDFINNLINSLKKIPQPKNINGILKPIGNLFTGISSIVNSNILKMKTSLNPLRGYLLGKQIGDFVHYIVKSVQGMNIDPSMKYLGNILQPLSVLCDPTHKFSMFKILKVFNKMNALIIASFFTNILNNVPKQEETNKGLQGVVQILHELFELTPEKIKAFKASVKALSPENATRINQFIKNLCDGDWNAKKLKPITQFFNQFKSVLYTIVGSIVVMTLLVTFAPITAVIASMTILTISINFMKNVMGDFITLSNEVKEPKSMMTIAKLMSSVTMQITGMIAILAIVTKLTSYTAIITSVIIMKLTLNTVKSFIEDLSGKNIQEGVIKAMSAMRGISILLLSLSISTAILTVTIEKNSISSIISGLLIVTLFTVGSVILIKKLSAIKKENLDTATNALLKISAAYAIISMVSAVCLRPIGKHLDDTLRGATLVLLIIGTMEYMTKKLEGVKGSSDAVKNILLLSGVFTVLSLVSLTILIPLGKQWENVTLGAALVSTILGLMIGGTVILSKHRKKMRYALESMVVLTTVLLGVSLVTKEILVPLGSLWESALKGAGVVLGIMAVLLLGVKLLTTFRKSQLLYGVLATASLAIILTGISLIVKEILIPIGNNAKDAVYGTVIVASILLGLVLTVKFLSKIKAKTLADSIMVTAALAVILLGISLITKEILIPIGQKPVDALKGAGVVTLILSALGGIMFAVGKLAKNKKVQEALLTGGIVISGISGVMAIIGFAMTPFIELAEKVNKIGKVNTLLASATILAILGTFGLVMAGIGLLISGPQAAVIAIAIAGGAAVMGGIATVMGALSFGVDAYLDMIEHVLAYDTKKLTNGSNSLLSVINTMYKVIAAAAPNPIQIVQMAAATAAVPDLKVFFWLLSKVVNDVIDITSNVTADIINNFTTLIIGSDGKGIGGNNLVGSINSIIKAFSDIDGVAGAAIISMAMRPIINTISQWIDVITKVAVLSYVSGYDDNGKPIYIKLPASVFGDAAAVVTTGFQNFLSSLNTGFKNLTILGTLSMNIISKLLKPVINLIGSYIDIIMKVATGTYIIGYDENGKPEYEHLTADQFGAAGEKVAEQFKYFLEKLNAGFEGLSLEAIIKMQIVSDTMKTIMDPVSQFVDSVIKVATMTIITGYDKNGKPEYEKIDVTEFETAGTKVAEQFGSFIGGLSDAFNKLTPQGAYAMNTVKDSIAPVMAGVSSFVDAIIKLSSGQYIDSYTADKDGNMTVPHFTKILPEEYITAAITIAGCFSLFITSLTNSFKKGDGNKTEDALEAISGTIGPVMDGVGKYVDVLMEMCAGKYLDHMEKDKKGEWVPIYKHVTSGMFKVAAQNLTKAFTTFVTTLVKSLNQGNLIELANHAKDIIKDSINPIMDAVKKFSDAIKPFLDLKTNDKDRSAKAEDYLCANPKFVTNISNNIANSFTSFVQIISTALNENKNLYAGIKQSANDVNQVMSQIMKAVKSLSNIISYMSDKEGKVLETGPATAQTFINTLTSFANYYSANRTIFGGIIGTARVCNQFIKEVTKTAKYLNDIINTIKTTNTEKASAATLINQFNNNTTKIVNQMNSLSTKSKNIDFSQINNLFLTYMSIATQLVNISKYMSDNPDMTSGINTFINNIKQLTSSSVNKQIVSSSASIRTYVSRLAEFDKKINVTTSKVKIYTTTLDKARKSLANLDAEIINKEKKRNDALQSFADKINNIAAAVNKMKRSFDSLDENKILSKFESVKNLIDTVLGNSNEPINNKNVTMPTNKSNSNVVKNTNVPAKTIVNGRNNGSKTNNYYNPSGFIQSGNVTFEFKNTTIHGFFKASNI